MAAALAGPIPAKPLSNWSAVAVLISIPWARDTAETNMKTKPNSVFTNFILGFSFLINRSSAIRRHRKP